MIVNLTKPESRSVVLRIQQVLSLFQAELTLIFLLNKVSRAGAKPSNSIFRKFGFDAEMLKSNFLQLPDEDQAHSFLLKNIQKGSTIVVVPLRKELPLNIILLVVELLNQTGTMLLGCFHKRSLQFLSYKDLINTLSVKKFPLLCGVKKLLQKFLIIQKLRSLPR